MTKARSLVGLDVHAAKIVAAVLDAETGELQRFAMTGESAGAAGFCAGLPGPVRVAYEAGPTGTQPAHISLTARRAQPAGPPPAQPTPAHPSRSSESEKSSTLT